MTHIAQSAALVLTTALLLGCGDSPSSDTEAGPATPGAAGNRAASGGGGDAEADLEELADYDLNMDDLQKYTVAQLNILRVTKAMEKSGADEGDESQDETDAEGNLVGGEDANTLGGMEARIESIPALRKAVEDAGLDAREYATISYAYMTSAMAAGVVKMGRPVDSVATAMQVNPDNVNFILQNEAKLAPLFERMEAEAKRLDGGS